MAKSFADWPFLYCAVSAVYQRLAKPRKEPAIFDIAPCEQFISDRPSPEASVAIFTSRHMNSLSAAGQAQRKQSDRRTNSLSAAGQAQI